MKRFSTVILLLLSGPLFAAESGESVVKPVVESVAKPVVQPLPYDNALNVVVGLSLILGLLFVAAWLVRRFQGVHGGDTRAIQVVSQLPMGVKERILLLRVGDENILVGCTPQSIRPLHSWQGPCPKVDENSAAGQGAFAAQIQQLLNKGKNP